MKNNGKYYAGQPYMLSIWDNMWHRIYTRLDDERDEIENKGGNVSIEFSNRITRAAIQFDVVEAMLDEAHQLQNNVAHMTDPIKWKFNLVMKGKPNG